MSIRARLALVAAAAVALAVVAASGVVYVVVRDQLYSSVDSSLQTSMERITSGPPFQIGEGPPQLGVFGGYPQVVRADGLVLRRPGSSSSCRWTSGRSRSLVTSVAPSSRTRTQAAPTSA